MFKGKPIRDSCYNKSIKDPGTLSLDVYLLLLPTRIAFRLSLLLSVWSAYNIGLYYMLILINLHYMWHCPTRCR